LGAIEEGSEGCGELGVVEAEAGAVGDSIIVVAGGALGFVEEGGEGGGQGVGRGE
jgi:hypothetical protein